MLTQSENVRYIKQNKAKMAKCRGCRYLGTTEGGRYLVCDYLWHTGHMRPCTIENCTVKELRPRKKNTWQIKTVALCIVTLAMMALSLWLCPETEAAPVEIPAAIERDADAECLMARTKAIARREGYKPETAPAEKWVYLGRYYITGYDICVKCCGKTDGITASGVKAQVGRTVAAPRGFAFGTRLYIDGIGERIVEDRGGAIKGNKIDVLCNNHPECFAITGYYNVYMLEVTP